MTYLLVDPFGSHTSGVSTYTRLAAARLGSSGMRVLTVARALGEAMHAFRQRVARTAVELDAFVEAPETMQAAQFVASDRLHIRLHGSRAFGQIIQNQRFEVADLARERGEIARARVVSCPSRIALLASGMSDLRTDIVCYPNPAPPILSNEVVRDIDVLFLGRFQRYKGTDFFARLVHDAPEFRFGAASGADAAFPKSVEWLPASMPEERSAALRRAKLVLLPSYFETASMVGLEAVAHGCRVAGWGHLGLSEYFAAPLYTVCGSFGAVDAEVLRQALVKPLGKLSCAAALDLVNDRFDQGVRSVMIGTEHIPTFMPFPNGSPDELNSIIQRCRAMNAHGPSIAKRKLRKLLRSPRAFFGDSWISHMFIRPGTRRVSHAAEVLPLEVIKATCNPGKVVQREGESLKYLPSIATKAESGLRCFVKIGTGRIEVLEPSKRVNGWNCGFLFNPERCEHEGALLLEEFKRFSDFSPLAKTLEVGHFGAASRSSLDMLNSMDVANKNRLSLYSMLVLFEAPSALVRALRCSNSEVRTVVVARAGFDDIDFDHTDVVIVDSDHVAAKVDPSVDGIRRRIVVERWQDSALAVRRAIQELGPRSPDMLIPLINANTFDPRLAEFDVAYHQGIIRLIQPMADSKNVLTMREVCHLLAERIDAMLVTESVYLRYRTLCEAVEAGGSASRLVERALFDGVLFHVQA